MLWMDLVVKGRRERERNETRSKNRSKLQRFAETETHDSKRLRFWFCFSRRQSRRHWRGFEGRIDIQGKVVVLLVSLFSFFPGLSILPETSRGQDRNSCYESCRFTCQEELPNHFPSPPPIPWVLRAHLLHPLVLINVNQLRFFPTSSWGVKYMPPAEPSSKNWE